MISTKLYGIGNYKPCFEGDVPLENLDIFSSANIKRILKNFNVDISLEIIEKIFQEEDFDINCLMNILLDHRCARNKFILHYIMSNGNINFETFKRAALLYFLRYDICLLTDVRVLIDKKIKRINKEIEMFEKVDEFVNEYERNSLDVELL